MKDTANEAATAEVPATERSRAIVETEQCTFLTRRDQTSLKTFGSGIAGVIAGGAGAAVVENSDKIRMASGVPSVIRNMAGIVDKVGTPGMLLGVTALTIGGFVAGNKLTSRLLPGEKETADTCAAKVVARIKEGNAAVTAAASKAGVTLN